MYNMKVKLKTIINIKYKLELCYFYDKYNVNYGHNGHDIKNKFNIVSR